MPIVQQGAINTTALVNPGVYAQIVPPQNLYLNGIPTNILGMVGTATWGPLNIPTTIGTAAQYTTTFGPIQARKYDLGTPMFTAIQQGAQNFVGVRVSDGTDAAASVVVGTTNITFTALYSGTLGNTITVTFSAGRKANTTAVVVGVPGGTSERFDNIVGTGNALWVAITQAVNFGTGTTRGPSAYVTATAGAGTTAPTLGTAYTLAGGSDGVATVTAATLVGSDTVPRKGMYALRGKNCSVALLSDADDSTQWTTQAGFGLAEGIYMILTAPAGSAVLNGTTGTLDLKATAGLDSYAAKLMHGDWLWWNDQTNNVTRLVSPQGFAAGKLAALSPEQSSLNKQLFGVVASQKSGGVGTTQGGVYTSADLQQLLLGGVDVIANPSPGGTYWGVQRGQNSSSNPAVNGDNYTRLINYIAASASQAAMGVYIGQIINPTLFQRIRATLLAFFANMAGQGQISSPDGSTPYSVICDISNNPQTRTSLGYVQVDCQVVFGPILLFLVLNLEAGQTVTINHTTTINGQIVN